MHINAIFLKAVKNFPYTPMLLASIVKYNLLSLQSSH